MDAHLNIDAHKVIEDLLLVVFVVVIEKPIYVVFDGSSSHLHMILKMQYFELMV